MKIPDEKQNAATAPAADSKQKPAGPAKGKPFAERIRKKAADSKKLPASGVLQGGVHDIPLTPQQRMFPASSTVSRASIADLPAPIQSLIHEIRLRVEPSGAAEVRIQFDSKTLDGLRVDIRKAETGSVAITFTTDNENTSRLLSDHIPALSQALATKGVPVAAIHLDSNRNSGDSTEGNTRESFRSSARRDARGRQRNRR